MTSADAAHLVLVNLGTPTAPSEDAVRAFLAEFLTDPAVVDWPAWIWQPVLRRMVLKRRPARVAHQYAAIWGPDGSPLRASTERIAATLRSRSNGRFRVHTAYRYGEPSLDTVLTGLAGGETGPIIITPLFPQRTGSTTGTAFRRAAEAARRAGVFKRVVERPIPASAAGYVDALADRWREVVGSMPVEPDHLVISYHGIPKRYDRAEATMYSRDCEETTSALLAAIRWPTDRATHAYQSKFGPERWLTPATANVLARLPSRGVRTVAVVTPGFVTDGLETIEEIGIRGTETFVAAGGARLVRIPAVDAHPRFIDALADLVENYEP